MLTKEAKNKNNFIKNRFYYNSARSAFIDLLRNLNLKSDELILFPSYIGQSPIEGSGVFDPVRKLNLSYMFYKINDDLSVNFDDIKFIIKEFKIKILFVIHYFGFVQKQIEEISEFCKKNKIILIEDCAHSLSSGINNIKAGTFGDYALFSIHKICASLAGGILQINNNSKSINQDNQLKIEIDDLLLFLNSDIESISNKRRINFEYYLKNLKETILYEIFYKTLPPYTVPLNFPILIKNFDRYEIYKKLLEMEVPCVSLWHTLIKEINTDLYPISKKISSSILNLPVHQDITKEDMDYIIEKLNFLK